MDSVDEVDCLTSVESCEPLVTYGGDDGGVPLPTGRVKSTSGIIESMFREGSVSSVFFEHQQKFVITWAIG